MITESKIDAFRASAGTLQGFALLGKLFAKA